MEIAPQQLAEALALAAQGDRAAFRRLYELSAPRLHAIALRLTRRADLAAEATQEAYIRIWRHAARFDPARGSAMAWMATILRRVALDRIPPERPYEDVATVEVAVPPPEPGEARLEDCLAALPERQRAAVLLVFYDGLTHAELAERLAVPLGTAKSRVRRGVEGLRGCLEGA